MGGNDLNSSGLNISKIIIASILLLAFMNVVSAQFGGGGSGGGGGGGGIDGPPVVSLITLPANITTNVSLFVSVNFSSSSRGFPQDPCAFCSNFSSPCRSWVSDNVTSHISDNFMSGNCSYSWNVSGRSDGKYNISFQVHDSAPYEVVVSKEIILDRFGPSIGYLSPSDDFLIASTGTSEIVEFSYLVDDVSKIANCSLLFGGKINYTNYSISGHTWLTIPVNFSINGNKTSNWSVACTDIFGFTNQTLTRKFSILDLAPPFVKITNPINGSWLSINKSWFNVTTSEDAVCEYYEFVCTTGPGIGGCGGISPPEGIIIKNMTQTGGTMHAQSISDLNETNSSFQFHEFRVSCKDPAGNNNLTGIKFFVDLAPPILSDNYGDRNNTWKSDTYSVILFSNDTKSGTANITYCIDLNGTCEPERIFVNSIVLTPQGEQILYLKYSGLDNAGNKASVRTIVAKLDVMPPSIFINNTKNASWVNQTQTLHANATDFGVGVDNLTYCISSINFSSCNNSELYVSPLIIDKEPFSYLLVQAFDKLGNKGGKAQILIKIDRTSPLFEAVEINNAVFNRTDNLSLSAVVVDNYSGVKLVTFTIFNNSFAINQSLINQSGEWRSSRKLDELSFGKYKINISAVDNVGNVAVITLNFSVIDSSVDLGNTIMFQGDFPEHESKTFRNLVKINASIPRYASLTADVLSESETKSYSLSNRDFQITLDFVGSVQTILTVNEERTSALREKETFRLGNGFAISIIDILSQEFAGGTRKVLFAILQDQSSGLACTLEWNGVNESMRVQGNECYVEKATFDGVDYTFRVYSKDSFGSANFSKRITFKENNAPTAQVKVVPSRTSTTKVASFPATWRGFARINNAGRIAESGTVIDGYVNGVWTSRTTTGNISTWEAGYYVLDIPGQPGDEITFRIFNVSINGVNSSPQPWAVGLHPPAESNNWFNISINTLQNEDVCTWNGACSSGRCCRGFEECNGQCSGICWNTVCTIGSPGPGGGGGGGGPGSSDGGNGSGTVVSTDSFTNDDLICEVKSVEDADEDHVSIIGYDWFNGTWLGINSSNLSASHTRKNQDWKCTVLLDDSLEKVYVNSSFTKIKNSLPVISFISPIEANETDLITISPSAGDIDNDSVEFVYSPPFNSSGQWQTNYESDGFYNVSVTAFEEESVTIKVGVTVFNHRIKGNLSNISTNLDNLSLVIGNVSDFSLIKNETLPIKFMHGNISRAQFDFNFSIGSLVSDRIRFEIQSNSSTKGYAIVRGINLTRQKFTKSILIDNLTTATGICIKDAEINEISEISAECTGTREFFVSCPGVNGPYSCQFVSSLNMLNISGLNHSGVVQQQTYCGDGIANGAETCSSCPADAGACPSSSSSGGGGGGGGGGSGGGGSGGGGGTASVSDSSFIQSISAGSSAVFPFTKSSELGVFEISVISSQESSNARISVQEAKLGEGMPSPVSSNENLYRLISINRVNLDQIASPSIKFKVLNSWMQQNSIDPSGIVLLRLRGSSWERNSARVIGGDASFTLFESSVPGFSVFAITGTRSVKEPEPAVQFSEEVPTEETPKQETEEKAQSEQPESVALPLGSSNMLTGAAIGNQQKTNLPLIWFALGIMIVAALLVIFRKKLSH